MLTNSVRICQNIQTEVSLERSILADVGTYQFINLNSKLKGSRKEEMHRSTWNENDQTVTEGLNTRARFVIFHSGRNYTSMTLGLINQSINQLSLI